MNERIDIARLETLKAREARLKAEHAGLRQAAAQLRGDRDALRQRLDELNRTAMLAQPARMGSLGRTGAALDPDPPALVIPRKPPSQSDIEALGAEIMRVTERLAIIDAEKRAKFQGWTAQGRLIEACESFLARRARQHQDRAA